MPTDREQIDDLLTDYAIALDIDDVEGCVQLFTQDGGFEVYGRRFAGPVGDGVFIEDDDTVAEQAPTLLRVMCNRVRRLAADFRILLGQQVERFRFGQFPAAKREPEVGDRLVELLRVDPADVVGLEDRVEGRGPGGHAPVKLPVG